MDLKRGVELGHALVVLALLVIGGVFGLGATWAEAQAKANELGRTISAVEKRLDALSDRHEEEVRERQEVREVLVELRTDVRYLRERADAK